jgi:hypothetical protein
MSEDLLSSGDGICSIFRGECVALTKNTPNFPHASGQCDGLSRFIEEILEMSL